MRFPLIAVCMNVVYIRYTYLNVWIITQDKNTKEGFSHPKHYGGQFHIGISGKRDKPIFILDGFGGQVITIDFENNKIIAILSIHRDHNWMKLVHSKF